MGRKPPGRTLHTHLFRTLFGTTLLGCAAGSLLAGEAPSSVRTAEADSPARIPVILDTDIGDDIDDTWALALLLKSPEFDIRLVVGDNGRSLYRARLIAKMLQVAGRTDIPVGVGLAVNRAGDGPQAPWVEDYDLERFPGTVHRDGVQAMIDVIMKSEQPVTLIAVGPLPNVAAALEREPAIAKKARFVGMHGSVRLGYGGSRKISAEYNVRADVKACQKVFTAAWDMIITPLDTCGLVHLEGQKYRAVRDSGDPVTSALIENYRIWAASHEEDGRKNVAQTRSSTLFDTVAIYLGLERDALVKIEELGIRVDDEGFTRIDPDARTMKVATEWKNLGSFEDFLVRRLTASGPATPE